MQLIWMLFSRILGEIMDEKNVKKTYGGFLFSYIKKKKRGATDNDIDWDVNLVIGEYFDICNGLLPKISRLHSKLNFNKKEFVEAVLLKIASSQIGECTEYKTYLHAKEDKEYLGQEMIMKNIDKDDNEIIGQIAQTDQIKDMNIFVEIFCDFLKVKNRNVEKAVWMGNVINEDLLKLHLQIVTMLFNMVESSSKNKAETQLRRKNVIILRLYHGYTLEQIADCLGENLSNVTQDWSRWWKKEMLKDMKQTLERKSVIKYRIKLEMLKKFFAFLGWEDEECLL